MQTSKSEGTAACAGRRSRRVSCSAPRPPPAQASASDEDDADDFTVAVVLPSAANDLAFSQSMVDSLERLAGGRRDRRVRLQREHVRRRGRRRRRLRDYAEAGHDLVIAHGSQYGGSLQEIAPDFPETAFAWGTAADTFGLDNVSGYTASADQGAYVMGAMGAHARRRRVRSASSARSRSATASCTSTGSSPGRRSVDPDLEVGVTYTESFSDTTLAAEAATSFIDGGATVLSRVRRR